jgi:hypothetical protein
MPHWKCTECHHEWDSTLQYFDLCEWCSHPGAILEEKTAFERWLEEYELRNEE